MRLVLCYPVNALHLQRIQAVDPTLEVVDAGQEGIAQDILAADLYCGHAKVPVDWAEVVRRGRLQWIQSSAAGVDHCLTPEVIASDIPVCSASGVLADQVAEQTFALLLGLLRGLPVFFQASLRREYIRRPTADLHGSIVTLVGFGGNGRRLAEVLRPWQVRLWATDHFPINKPNSVERLECPEKLDEMLPHSDVVILAAPLNDQTRGMFHAERLARMKTTGLLINVARGKLVVENDLVAALQNAELAGAGLDVAEVEPLPASSRLWELPNVIITPHVGGQSARRIDKMTDLLCENLRRWLDGKSPWNLVDKKLGFPHPSATQSAAGSVTQ